MARRARERQARERAEFEEFKAMLLRKRAANPPPTREALAEAKAARIRERDAILEANTRAMAAEAAEREARLAAAMAARDPEALMDAISGAFAPAGAGAASSRAEDDLRQVRRAMAALKGAGEDMLPLFQDLAAYHECHADVEGARLLAAARRVAASPKIRSTIAAMGDDPPSRGEPRRLRYFLGIAAKLAREEIRDLCAAGRE